MSPRQNAAAQAAVLLGLDRAGEAKELLEAHLRVQPEDGWARAYLVESLLALGDPEAAARAVDSIPREQPFVGTAARLRATIAVARAKAQRGTGRGWRRRQLDLLTDAIAHAEDAVRLDPGEWRSHMRLSLVHTAAAEATGAPHHFEMAVRAGRESVRAAGADPEASARSSVTLASAAARLPHHRAEAMRAARHAVALDPTNPAYTRVLAAVQHQSMQEARSMASSLRALRAAPTDRSAATLARFSLHAMLSRMLTLSACIAFVVALVSLGGLSSQLGMPVAVRVGGFLDVVAVSAVVGLIALPVFRDAEVRRAITTFGRKRVSAWLAASALAVALLLSLASLTTGWPFGVAFTGLMLPIAAVVHACLGWRIRG